MAQIGAAPTINASGTYNMYFEYCQPKSGKSDGVFQTHHGLIGNAGYWNVQLEHVRPMCGKDNADDIAESPITRLPSLQLPPTGLLSHMIDLVSDDPLILTVLKSFRSHTKLPSLPLLPRCSEKDKSETEFLNSARSSELGTVRPTLLGIGV